MEQPVVRGRHGARIAPSILPAGAPPSQRSHCSPSGTVFAQGEAWSQSEIPSASASCIGRGARRSGAWQDRNPGFIGAALRRLMLAALLARPETCPLTYLLNEAPVVCPWRPACRLPAAVMPRIPSHLSVERRLTPDNVPIAETHPKSHLVGREREPPKANRAREKATRRPRKATRKPRRCTPRARQVRGRARSCSAGT
jgi:hypothetical protein